MHRNDQQGPPRGVSGVLETKPQSSKKAVSTLKVWATYTTLGLSREQRGHPTYPSSDFTHHLLLNTGKSPRSNAQQSHLHSSISNLKKQYHTDLNSGETNSHELSCFSFFAFVFKVLWIKLRALSILNKLSNSKVCYYSPCSPDWSNSAACLYLPSAGIKDKHIVPDYLIKYTPSIFTF